MTKINNTLYGTIQNLSNKAYYGMSKEEKEWHDICTYIVPFIAQKYKFFPEIRHNMDANNSKNYKLPDFHFITKGIEEIPEGYYEHTLICGKWDHNSQSFLNPSKQELMQKINIDYEKKNKKEYVYGVGLKGLIFSCVRTNSRFQPLSILENFRNKNGNFDILIFIGSKDINYSFLLIYNKQLNIGYEIHIEPLIDKFLIQKDIKIDFLTNTFYDRIFKK